MARSKDISGVEARLRFLPKEPSLKVLVHHAGTIEGYDKVIPLPPPRDRQPRRPDPQPPEPSQRRAGERFGPIELPESVVQKYDTMPLGTLPLADSPPEPTPAPEPAGTRVHGPHAARLPLVLGAALIVSVLVSAWGAIGLMPGGPPAEAGAPAARGPSTQPVVKPRAPVARPAVVTREAAPPPTTAPPDPALPSHAMVRPRTATGPEKRLARGAHTLASAPPTPQAKARVEVEPAVTPNQSSPAPASREANDLMLGEW